MSLRVVQIPYFLAALALAVMLAPLGAAADNFVEGVRSCFTTGDPDARIGSVSHPEGTGTTEHESADDFILTSKTMLQDASFTGVLFHGGQGRVSEVVVELYHVFPKDSDTIRTPKVPTRTNSPADKRFDARSSSMPGELSFTVTVINPHFMVANSVIENINPLPHQTTGGEGPVMGKEVRLDVVFVKPFDLPADHYFFVPQVLLKGKGAAFLWLSTPHPQFPGDLQMWVRKEDLKPDWLRVGQDVVGGTQFPTFDGSFFLSGVNP